MIHGDIDLTENLDFYRDKKEREDKSTSLIPWKPKNNINKNNIIWSNISYTNWINNTDYYTINIPSSTGSISIAATTITTANGNIYAIPTQDSYNITTNWSTNWSTNTNYSFTLPLSYTTYIDYTTSPNTAIDISADDNDNLIIYDNENTKPKSTKTNIPWKHLEREGPESIQLTTNFWGIYGNKHRTLGPCRCQECRDIRKSRNNIYLTKLPFKKRYNEDKKYIEQCRQEKILFYFTGNMDYLSYSNRSLVSRQRWNKLFDSAGDSGRKIPWLRKLGYRIYEDYIKDLYEEQDYSSYLTNMGWIGIN